MLRIVAGLGFLHHGTSKFFNLPPFPMPLNGLLTLAGVLELAGGALIVLGFMTRPVAFVLAGMSAVAYFMVHAPKSLYPSVSGGEPAMLYCFIFLYLAAADAGQWTVDAMRAKA